MTRYHMKVWSPPVFFTYSAQMTLLLIILLIVVAVNVRYPRNTGVIAH